MDARCFVEHGLRNIKPELILKLCFLIISCMRWFLSLKDAGINFSECQIKVTIVLCLYIWAIVRIKSIATNLSL